MEPQTARRLPEDARGRSTRAGRRRGRPTALEKKIRAVEDRLLQPTLAEADQKSFRGPLELYLKLLWLQAEVGPGAADVSGNADFPPTQPELDVYALLSGQLAQVRRDYDDLYGKDVPAFNDAMTAKGYVRIMTVREVEKPPAEKEEEEDEDAAADARD